MNIVKQSLVLCIGLLLGLLALQGGQSLWQVSRLSSATEAIVAGNQVATQTQVLWNSWPKPPPASRTVRAMNSRRRPRPWWPA
jgi:hypothetical protein